MYIKLFKYTLRPERSTDFLALQKEVDAVYQKYAKVGFEFLQDEENPGAWVEIQYYEDKETYEKALKGVRSELNGHLLRERFLAMLDPHHPDVEENTFLSYH